MSQTLNNESNLQSTRVGAKNNPRLHVPTNTQCPQKLNIWAGIVNNKIIGPLEIVGNLTAESYLELLQNNIGPVLEDAVRPNPPSVPTTSNFATLYFEPYKFSRLVGLFASKCLLRSAYLV